MPELIAGKVIYRDHDYSRARRSHCLVGVPVCFRSDKPLLSRKTNEQQGPDFPNDAHSSVPM